MKTQNKILENKIINENSLSGLRSIPDNSIDCCITSPPYFQQCDYKKIDQIGLEKDVESYLQNLNMVFNDVYRVLKDGGCLWIIIGETYNNYSYVRSGSKDRKNNIFHSRRKLIKGFREKEPLLIPYRIIETLRKDGWVFRSQNVWDKGIAGQILTSDKPVQTHEYVLQFFKYSKSGRPYANCSPIKSSVFKHIPANIKNHPCPYPVELVIPLILASSNEGEIIIDPFIGAGTTALAAIKSGRKYIGFELNEEYIKIANKRLHDEIGMFL